MIKKVLERITNYNKRKSVKVDDSIDFEKINIREERIFRDLLANDLTLLAIPDVFKLLLSNNEKMKLQAAEILNNFVRTLSFSQLVKMDTIFRERTSFEWYYDWNNKNPNDLIHPLMSQEEKITILGLSSFHPNGYFREKAILALSNIKTGNEIPYILIRLNDWVSQVRDTSKEQLERYITLEYITDFVDNLPLVLRLRECSRDEHSHIIDKIISIMTTKEGSEKLIYGLQSTDSKMRLACYKIILERKVIDNKSIIKYLIKDSDPYNRLFVLRNIKNEITGEEFIDISQLLINDKHSQIRIIGLELLYYFASKEAINMLEKSLFDNNQAVRELSRYLLSKNKKYDFAAIYHDGIEKNDKLYSSICGLGETGNKNDSKLIAKFIDSDITKIVKASIISLAGLNMEEYKEKILLFLNDKRAGISKTARKVLGKEINANDIDNIYKIFKEDTYYHVKVNSAILLCSLSKWNAIRYILELCADKEKEISMLGQRTLERWKLKYNQSFIAPSNIQIKELREALECFGKSIKDSDRYFIESCIRDFSK
ncbi:hypothetical protein [Clostridium sp. ATCC 25772]|uniref:HEAT repeat domain-containing protein n=1 Tax=Clostridium sp. ATCC 25772 TaxID=1676991 RepID=UPI0007867522|nr:hypothetical protein [Clostridium sp. ATCC 25772]